MSTIINVCTAQLVTAFDDNPLNFLADRHGSIQRAMCDMSPYRQWSWIIGRCGGVRDCLIALTQAEPILYNDQPAWRKR